MRALKPSTSRVVPGRPLRGRWPELPPAVAFVVAPSAGARRRRCGGQRVVPVDRSAMTASWPHRARRRTLGAEGRHWVTVLRVAQGTGLGFPGGSSTGDGVQVRPRVLGVPGRGSRDPALPRDGARSSRTASSVHGVRPHPVERSGREAGTGMPAASRWSRQFTATTRRRVSRGPATVVSPQVAYAISQNRQEPRKAGLLLDDRASRLGVWLLTAVCGARSFVVKNSAPRSVSWRPMPRRTSPRQR